MRCLGFWLIILISSCLWLMTAVLPLVAAKSVGERGLFTLDDNVEVLHKNNVKRWLHRYPPTKIMVFYADWCGHCQRFAPVFKEFAADAAEIRHIIHKALSTNSDPTLTPRKPEI